MIKLMAGTLTALVLGALLSLPGFGGEQRPPPDPPQADADLVVVLHGLGRILSLAEDDRQVSIAYEQSGNQSDEIVYVELGLSESNEGDQKVRVKVSDLVSGRSADRTITFRVVPSR